MRPSPARRARRPGEPRLREKVDGSNEGSGGSVRRNHRLRRRIRGSPGLQSSRHANVTFHPPRSIDPTEKTSIHPPLHGRSARGKADPLRSRLPVPSSRMASVPHATTHRHKHPAQVKSLHPSTLPPTRRLTPPGAATRTQLRVRGRRRPGRLRCWRGRRAGRRTGAWRLRGPTRG